MTIRKPSDPCEWPQLLYRFAEFFRWEPQHNGEKVEEFRQTIRRLEVPLNYFFMVFLRLSPPGTIRQLLAAFGLGDEVELGEVFLRAPVSTKYTQPDVRLESKTARIYIEIKVRGKVRIQQVQKYLLLNAEMDTRYGCKQPYLLFLTPKDFSKHWENSEVAIDDVHRTISRRVIESRLGSLEKIASEMREQYDNAVHAVRYGATTWRSVGLVLQRVRDQQGQAAESYAATAVLTDFIAELQRRGLMEEH